MNPFLALVQTQSKPRGGVNYDKPIGPPAPKRESYQDQLSRLQNAGKSRTREDEQLDAILKGDFNKAKQIRDNDRAKKRAARGDVKTVAQKKTETPGTWNNSVAQARKRLGIKQGEDLDSLLKSALWVYRYSDADETTSKAEIDDVVRMMQSPEGRNELKARIERFRNPQKPEQQVKAGNLSESELEAKRREFEFQDSMDASGLGKTFRTIEDSQAKIESNPFLQMASKTAGALAETATLPGIALNAAGVDVAGITEDVTKSAVSGTLTTPARIPANLMKLVSGGVPIEQRGYALAELIADALDVGGLTGMALKANKAGIKEVVKALAEEAVKAGNVAEDVIEQAVKAIDDIPKEQLDEITYSFRQPENVGGDVGAEFRPNNNKSVISESPPGSTQSANTKPAQDEAGFFNARSAPNYTWKVDDFAKIPDAGREVDGLVVRESVPNMDSIEASIENATEIGVKAVPMSWFEDTVRPLANASRDAHVEDLAKQIAESGEVNPLIVVLDGDGKPYILEGAHRFEALLRLGKNQFPALVVRDEDSMFGALRKAIKSGNDVPLDVIDEYLEFYNASTIQEDGLLYPMIRHRQNTGGKPLVPQEQLRNFVQSEVSKGNNVPDDIKEIAGLGDAKVTQNIADDLPPVTDTAADVPKAVKVPDELKGRVDETFLGKKADEWEERLKALQAKPKKPRTKESGGLDPDVLEEAVLRAGIAVARTGEPIEQAVRTALKQMGLSDESVQEVRDALDAELGAPRIWGPEYKQATANPATRGTVAENERAAKEFGFEGPDLEKSTAQKITDQIQSEGLVDRAEELARRVMDGEVLSTAEGQALRQAARDRSTQLKSVAGALSKARRENNTEAIRSLQQAFDDAFAQAEQFSQAARLQSRKLGQGLQSIKNDFANDIYSPEVARELAKAKSPNGTLPADFQKELDDLTSRLAEREAEIEKLRTGTRRARAESTRVPRKRTEVAKKRLDEAKTRTKDLWDKGNFFTTPDQTAGMFYFAPSKLTKEAVEAIKDLAEASWELGAASLDEVVQSVRKSLKELGVKDEDLSDQDIVDSIAASPVKSKADISKEVQDLRNRRAEVLKQARKASTTSRKAEAKAEEIRKAKQKLRDIKAMDKAALDLEKAADAERAAKLSEDEKYWNQAVKTLTAQAEKDFGEEWRFFDRVLELENQIDDLTGQLKSGAYKTPQKPIRAEKDPLLEKLEAERDELQLLVRKKIAAAAPTGNWEFARMFARGLGFTNPVARFFDATANTFKYIYESASKPADKIIESMLFPNMEKSGTAWNSFNRSREASKGFWNRVWGRTKNQFKHGESGLLEKIEVRKDSNLKMRASTPAGKKIAEGVDNLTNFLNRTPGYTDIPFHQRAYDIALLEGVDNEVAYMTKKNGWSKAEALDYRAQLLTNEKGELEPIKLAAQEIADELIWANTTKFDEMFQAAKGGIKRTLGDEKNEGLWFAIDTIVTRYPTIFAKILGYTTDHVAGGLKAARKAYGIKAAGKASTPQEQRVISQLLRRNAVGAALMVMGTKLADDRAFDDRIELNKKLGYVDFGDLDQLGGPMSIILRGYALRAIDRMDATPSQKQALRNDVVMSLYANQPIVGGSEQAFRNLASSRGNPSRFAVQKVANTVIPAGLREAARRLDPDPGSKVLGDARYVETKPKPDKPWAEQDMVQVAANEVKARIPGLRNKLPPKD